MRSLLQIEASRRNSQKSTGPRTPAGKAISSLNSTTSGIYAESEIVNDENAADLDALSGGYVDRFHPDAPEQRCLIDILVHSEWTLRRLRRAEAQLWDLNVTRSAPGYGNENIHPLGRALSYDSGKVFARLQHRITATQRNYERALKELQQLQADRPAPQPPAQVEPAPAIQPVSVPLGFVSSPKPSPPPAAQGSPVIAGTSLPKCTAGVKWPLAAYL